MNQKWTALLLTTAMLTTGASAALAYETLQPGSNGQEVLDARMRLYGAWLFQKTADANRVYRKHEKVRPAI